MYTTLCFWVLLLFTLVPYYFIKGIWQQRYLLALSLIFLTYLSLQGLLIAVLSGWVCYIGCKRMQHHANELNKKRLYALHVFILILLLAFARLCTWQYHAIVFAGISFYTLMLFALLSEVYIGNMKEEVSVEQVWHYQLFFPRLLQGPIQFPQDFFNQINAKKEFDKTKITKAFLFILIGLVKKMAIADRLHYAANIVFENPHGQPALLVLLSSCIFSLQLYFDFSGYTDIVRGVSLLFGYELPINFNFPFCAKSITEFWRRWHMSFMQWLNKYIFSPLYYYFKHNTSVALPVSMLITFAMSAFWHSVGVQFLFWGMFHAIIIIIEYYFFRKIRFQKNISKFISPLIVFFIFTLGNIFFHAHDVQQAFVLFFNLFNLQNIFPNGSNGSIIAVLAKGGDHETMMNFYGYISLTLLFLFLEKLIYKQIEDKKYSFLIFFALSISLLLFGNFISSEKFIYTNF